MIAYCRNNPILRKDFDGKADEKADDLDGDPTDGNDELRGGSASTGSGYMPVSTWDGLRTALKDGAKGLSMAMGEKTATQAHHLWSDKHSKYSNEYKKVIENKYGLDLKDDWNIRTLEHHQGRHTNAYHEFALEILGIIDSIAQNNVDMFLKGAQMFGDFLVENDWIPYGR